MDVFRCRKCRSELFSETSVNAHSPGGGQSSFKSTKRSHYVQNSCTAIFLQEAETWMGNVEAPEGKLYCPKCNSRIGSWKWYGEQCSCGHWCSPSFQVVKSRIDVCASEASAAVMPRISQPNNIALGGSRETKQSTDEHEMKSEKVS